MPQVTCGRQRLCDRRARGVLAAPFRRAQDRTVTANPRERARTTSMENNRNFFITIALSVLILTLWQVFYMNPRIEAQREAARIEAERVEAEQKAAAPAARQTPGDGRRPRRRRRRRARQRRVPGTDGASPASREAALAATQRVKIDTPRLSGSINLTGARHRRHPARRTITRRSTKNSPTIELLTPCGAAQRLFRRDRLRRQRRDAGTCPAPTRSGRVEGNADADARPRP